MPSALPLTDFEELARTMRPKLHRYCSRMAGSSIDGEDIVQDALLKATQAGMDATVADPEAWLFRIAHNAAIDFLRRRVRLQAISVEQRDEEAVADPNDEVGRHEIAAMGLRPFMKLSPAERSSVILMDVIGYSAREVGLIMNATTPAVKAALHRGRTRLASLGAQEQSEDAVELSEREHERLAHYVDRFNARDFDAVRKLLAEDVHLEIVGRMELRGKREVERYFGNYGSRFDWQLAVGAIEGRPAVLLRNTSGEGSKPTNFILLEWQADSITSIRDFHYTAYVLECALAGPSTPSPAAQ
ncbi:MAG: sigma-70 family RNA polymerase sigma factor [Hyphomicrobiales bacterium]|nr:sigma-70 family RNA polymerase sigma factor [Hyphomicrobiales bacterium]